MVKLIVTSTEYIIHMQTDDTVDASPTRWTSGDWICQRLNGLFQLVPVSQSGPETHHNSQFLFLLSCYLLRYIQEYVNKV